MNAQPERPESSVDPKLLEILVCPLTKGPLEFDAKGDIKNPVYNLYIWKDGKSAPM